MQETAQAVQAKGINDKVAIALAFGSSAAVMVLELVALRLVAPYLGLTLETNTAVIGVALAAIATGAAMGGRIADSVPPTRSLGPLIVLAGALVLLILPAVRWTGEVLRGGGGQVVFLVVAVALFLPASLLAAVTPMVTKLRLSTLAQTGTVVGRLSAYATVGAIAGTVLTGFVFVAKVPTSTIVLWLGGFLVLAGAALTIFFRGLKAAAKPLALALIGTSLTLVAPRPCEVETAYHCARIEKDPARASGRTLYLDQLRHSYVDLDDPTYLEFEYAKNFVAAIDTKWPGKSPLEALHIGAGGLTIPNYLKATRPGTRNKVYEIDPGVIEVDKAELGAKPGPDLDIQIRDGRLGVRSESADSRDLLVMDAFGGVAVPWHLTTREIVADARRVLKADGLYLVNVIDFGPQDFLKAELRTIAAEFPHVGLIAKPTALTGEAGGNFVLLASDQPLPGAAIRQRLGSTAGYLDDPAGIERFVGDAPLLTDDYAPVDQLLTPFAS
ncbi:fused MFS/spermidine synthase [Kribbella sp. CA-293567]|uniref:fused MFS/spermidine synthase n=1 Tax=Kribbella sp. CA-293567 TaxID=3002436 RepID=UPI0022DE4B3C|nr:fused MFS/spermidine synthase [Kribbella sp. CA-293567]WBQ08625.1 fused MFS/spermidine synthase [Kribbella sp. CA-293567]